MGTTTVAPLVLQGNALTFDTPPVSWIDAFATSLHIIAWRSCTQKSQTSHQFIAKSIIAKSIIVTTQQCRVFVVKQIV